MKYVCKYKILYLLILWSSVDRMYLGEDTLMDYFDVHT